jgi:hypothetical protein
MVKEQDCEKIMLIRVTTQFIKIRTQVAIQVIRMHMRMHVVAAPAPALVILSIRLATIIEE